MTSPKAVTFARSGSRRVKTVVEVHEAPTEAALTQQLDLAMDAGRQSALATAHQNRGEEEMELVDQPLGYRLEIGRAHV